MNSYNNAISINSSNNNFNKSDNNCNGNFDENIKNKKLDFNGDFNVNKLKEKNGIYIKTNI